MGSIRKSRYEIRAVARRIWRGWPVILDVCDMGSFRPCLQKLMRYYEDLRDGTRPEDGELEGDSQCKDVDDDEMAETCVCPLF